MPPTAEDLLAHAGWLRRLAVSLVGPAAGADDLVQETWLAALRHPPERDGPLRPWLGRVLRNLVKMRYRAGAVRQDRRPEVERLEEERAERAQVGAADTVLDRFESERLLARLVAELDEPYRATLLLRYFEGWSAADIARHQGVPAGTVRWRLKTALDRLRDELDHAAKGDRKNWRLLLMPLALSATSAKVVKGLWTVTRIQKVVVSLVVLLCLVGVAVFVARRPAVVPPPHAGAPVTAAAPAAPAPSSPVAQPHEAPPRSQPQKLVPARVQHEPRLQHGAFSGQVRNFSTGAGVPGAQVTFAYEGASQSIATDADGVFHFEPPAAGSYNLAVVTAPGFLPFAPEWGTSPIALSARPGLHIRDVVIYLSPAIDYTGVVVDPDGKPVAGAEVRIVGLTGEQALVPLTDRFVSDASGEFVFHAHDDALLEASKKGFAAGRARLAGGAQVAHRLTIALGRVGAEPSTRGQLAITGRVVDAGGAPVKAAMVRAEPKGYDPLAMEGEARVGDDGHFRLAGLDPGDYTVHAGCPGCTRAEATVAAGGDVTLRLEPGGSIAGKIVDDGGAAVASFTVAASQKTGPLTEHTVAQATVIDAEGRFQMDGLTPGEYHVRATGSGYAPSEPVTALVTSGDDATEVVIHVGRGGSIAGRVVERGTAKPLALARVSIEHSIGAGSSAVPLVANTLTDDQGQFVLDGLPPGIRSATAAAYGHNIVMKSGLRVDEGHVLGPLVFELTATKDGEEPTTEMVGIGAVLAAQGEVLMIEKAMDGGGAQLAGLAAGDAILSIDNVPLVALGMENAVQRIRGPEDSVVILGVRRPNGFSGVWPVRRVRLSF